MKNKLLAQLTAHPKQCELTLNERLPHHIHTPCTVHCEWKLETHPGYTILHLNLKALLTLSCQRCAATFESPFEHSSTLAICDTQQTLEKLLSTYDSLLKEELPEDLSALITDELHLYAPGKHTEPC